MLIITVLMVSFIALLAWAWVRGIDDMKDNHPDYKGEDFLDWDVTLEDGLEDEDKDKDKNDQKT